VGNIIKKVCLLLNYDDSTGSETVEGVYSSPEMLIKNFINHSTMDGYYLEEYIVDSDEPPMRYPLRTVIRMNKYQLI
jgi:hypothetical protein